MKYPLLISSLALSLLSLPASANHEQRYRSANSGYFYDFAKVQSVQPITETIEHRVPTECRYQSSDNQHRRSATSAILGGIIGAAIGNELGHHKSNKQVGAVAGGILGASIGSDMGQRRSHHRCVNAYDIEYLQQVVGYDVSYRYRGNTYFTQTKQHPGKKIQLKLSFEPLLP